MDSTSFRIVIPILVLLLGVQAKGGAVSKPVFSRTSGIYNTPFNLTISSATPGAIIIYTTDGSIPTPRNGRQTPANSPVTILLESSKIIRAIAVKKGMDSTKVKTHTFLFPSTILGQKHPSKFPESLDFEMDPRMTSNSEVALQIVNSLKTIPIVSIIGDTDEIFGPQGLYSNPKESGDEWEKSVSFEWIPPEGKRRQADCGVKIQGASSRTVSKKHGLRLSFKSSFGPKKFKADLFDEGSSESFDSLVLRNPTHDSWAVGEGDFRNNARYVNDMWAAQTQHLMGHASPRSRWVHLFLNGYYWGLYALSERPDEHFAVLRWGGEDEDYDVFNANRLRSGSHEKRNELRAILASPAVETELGYKRIKQLLDLEGFIDYVLLNLYANNIDWIDKNFWLIGQRTENPMFRFVNWDAEILFWETWESPRNPENQSALDFDLLSANRLYVDTQAIGFLLTRLHANSEFRKAFSDRAHLHTKDGGVFSPAIASTLYRNLLDQVTPHLTAESARWGDVYEETPLGTSSPEWQDLTGKQSWLFAEFFPGRTKRFLEQLEASKLYFSE